MILRSKISDAKIAYSVIFGNASESVTSEYDRNAKLRFIKEEIFPSRKNISFEENRERLIDLIDEIQAQAKLGGIKAKDAVAQEAAIRVQLERTFSDGVKEEGNQIIVESRFSDVCPNCHHEIPLPTKERAMKIYNLIEKTKNEQGYTE